MSYHGWPGTHLRVAAKTPAHSAGCQAAQRLHLQPKRRLLPPQPQAPVMVWPELEVFKCRNLIAAAWDLPQPGSQLTALWQSSAGPLQLGNL